MKSHQTHGELSKRQGHSAETPAGQSHCIYYGNKLSLARPRKRSREEGAEQVLLAHLQLVSH